MNILIVSSEIAPYAKSGGLGDVIGSLPKALRDQDIDARVVFPKYGNVNKDDFEDLKYYGNTNIRLGWRNQPASIYGFEKDFPVYFIENDYYFDRFGMYGHGDDFERFSFFTKAAIELMYLVGFKADIVHFNDWQTGLGSIYLKDFYSKFTFYSEMKTVYTIHNLQYQGIFGKDILNNIDLNDGYGSDDKLGFFDNINFMKGGIEYADAITTVSDTYSKEIQRQEYGYMLDGLLARHHDNLYGIVNGIDVDFYNPATNKYLYQNFDINSLHIKKENKKALQRQLGLPERDVPMISVVSRLATQKGFDILGESLHTILQEDVQFVLLGTGEGIYENMFREFQHSYPDKLSANILFSEDLANKIYSSSDLFLMPSLFEPCGLGQMIAMQYGTIPIVRHTGGLYDTVEHNYRDETNGTGFVFENYDAGAIIWGVREALHAYYRDDFNNIIRNAMSKDFSWNKSAEKYKKLYEKILNR